MQIQSYKELIDARRSHKEYLELETQLIIAKELKLAVIDALCDGLSRERRNCKAFS